MPNPHRNENGMDFGTGIRHCVGCDTPLHNADHTLADHLFVLWKHWLWSDYPEVLATDEDGKTIEGVVAIPARRVLSVLPSHTSVSFCKDCAPSVVTLPGRCGKCGLPVDPADEHSETQMLWKFSSQYNGRLEGATWHIPCLPEQLQAVNQERQARHSNR